MAPMPARPTHAEVEGVAVDVRHWIGGERVASERTFADVSPMRGVILGGDQHELEVRVTVLPLQGADAVPLGQTLEVRYEELGP